MSEYSSLKLFFLPLRLGVDDNESKEGNGMKNEPFMTFVSICLFRERFWEGKFAFLCVFFLFLCFCLRSTKKRTCEQAFLRISRMREASLQFVVLSTGSVVSDLVWMTLKNFIKQDLIDSSFLGNQYVVLTKQNDFTNAAIYRRRK